MKFLHPIDPSVYLHWPVIEAKCWVPVNHVLKLLSIPTVNTSGCPYNFLENEFKDTQKQITENIWTWKQSFMHLPIEICSSFSNSLIIIGNVWKHLTEIHIKASFFCFLYSYSWLFQWVYIWNNEIKYLKDQTPQLWSIKPASTLNILSVNSWKPVNLGDYLQRKGDFYYRDAIISTFTPWKWIFTKVLNHKCS